MSDSRNDLPPVNSPNFLEKVREAISTYLGTRGNRLDRGLTVRDLADAGVVSLSPGWLANGGRRSPVAGVGAAVQEVAVYEPDLTAPPTPSGFAATAAISNLLIECGAPTYTQGHGHARSLLYGAQWTSGPLPVFAQAQVITEFNGTVASYATTPSTTWHLWLKWVSADGVKSAPAGGTNGVVVTTGQDVALLINALAGEITASELHTSLGTRIDLIDTPTTGLQAQLAGANASIATINATLADIASTPPYDNAAAYVLDDIVTYGGGLYQAKGATTGNLPTNTTYWAKIGDYASIGDAVAGHAVILSDHATRITTAEEDVTAVAGRATTLETAINNANTGLATKASVTEVATAKAEAIAAAAAVTETISARLDSGDFAQVQVQSEASASSVTGLLAQYTVKLDVNGKVSGYGLASSDPTGTGSTFEIRADKFVIAAPTGSAAGYVPFSVLAVPTVIGGITLPAGVYAQNAFIQDLQVTAAKISSVHADSIQTGYLSAVTSHTGALYNGVNAYTLSTDPITGVVTATATNQTPGTVGFGTGYCLSNNMMFVGSPTNHMLWNGSSLVVRGTVYASAGLIGGMTIERDSIYSSHVTLNQGVETDYFTGTGFGVMPDGRLLIGNATGNRITWNGININVVGTNFSLVNGTATLTGSVYANNGYFKGSLEGANITGATGTFSGLLSATSLGAMSTDVVTYTTSTTLTVPVGMNSCSYILIGGGGSGSNYGGGGGGGGVIQGVFNVAAGTNLVLTIGAGGYAITSEGSGVGGGTTSIGGYASVPGGGGGIHYTGGGAGGAAGNSNATAGGPRVDYSTGGYGGQNNYSTGGAGNGGNGTGYGGGGGGRGWGGTSGAGSTGAAIISFVNSNGVVLQRQLQQLKVDNNLI